MPIDSNSISIGLRIEAQHLYKNYNSGQNLISH